MRHTFVRRVIAVCLACSAVVAVGAACNDRDSTPRNTPGRADDPRSEDDEGRSVGAGSSSDTVGQAGAGENADAVCSGALGRYKAAFEQRSGDCGDLALDRAIKVDNSILIEKFPEVDIETETIVKGCALFFHQTERNRSNGLVLTSLQANQLEFDGGETIAGAATLMRFDERGLPACKGEYDATFTNQHVVVGDAVGRP